MKQVTLCNLRDCTEQEVFDFIAHHLLTQNRQSLNKKSGECFYRNGEGLSCAAGCLMTDQEYQPTFEGLSWFVLAKRGIVPTEHQSMIDALQILHDSYNPADWKDGLTELAHSRGLEFHG